MPAREFGAWLPDIDEMNPVPHLRDAKGCLPGLKSYGPFPSLVATTDALSEAAKGMIGVRDINQAGHVIVGTSETLQKLSGLGWEDYSKSGGYGPAVESTRWRFTLFGDRLIATNFIDPVQYLDLSGGAPTFDDLPDLAVTAEFVATYDEFVFVASTGASGLMLKWSGIGDSENWTAGTGLSDEQELPDGGRITGLGTANRTLFVFQQQAIRRVSFVGGDVIFTIEKIVDGVGCAEPNSLVQYGQSFFFLGEDGFYAFDGTTTPQPIGNEKFDRWFLEDSERAYWHTMSAAIDPRRKIVVWAYASTSSAGGVPDTLLVYDYALGKASHVRMSTELIASTISVGVSPDDLTDYVPDDHPEIGPDDPFWLGGVLSLAAVNTDHKLASFSGANVAASFVMSPAMMFDGRRSSIAWAKPLADTTEATVAAAAKVRPGDTISFPPQEPQQASGRCPQRGANGFYHAAKVEIPEGADWTFASGVEFEPSAARSVR